MPLQDLRDEYLQQWMKGIPVKERRRLAAEVGSTVNYLNQVASKGASSPRLAKRILYSFFNRSRPPEERYQEHWCHEVYWDRDNRRFQEEASERLKSGRPL